MTVALRTVAPLTLALLTTHQVRALLPGARINLGDDRRPHLAVEAMLRMSTAARP